jgi:hypothetical protein
MNGFSPKGRRAKLEMWKQVPRVLPVGFPLSALFGIAFRSWVVFGVMFLASFWLLNRPRGTVHMIYAMSLLWGFIAFSVGHSISWGWATALGMAFFLLGVGAHLTDLKKPVVSTVVSVNQNNIEWRRNGYQGRQNLN